MSLRLYDTATRSVRPFEPLRPGVVSLYNCGATVQWHPHIGHLRGAGVVYDVLRRWLEYNGFEVRHVRNVTDIDDKILVKAAEAGPPLVGVGDHARAQLLPTPTTCSAACGRRSNRGPPATSRRSWR